MKHERKILHVDDDSDMLRLVSTKLSSHGYKITSVDDPTVVPGIIFQSGARLVLLDIDMPHVNGITLLKQIKQVDGGIQAVMLTSLVSMGTALESMRAGAEACLFKPITDFGPLLMTLDLAYGKIDRWRQSLKDLRELKESHPELATAGNSDFL